jgi:hypothetical protein
VAGRFLYSGFSLFRFSVFRLATVALSESSLAGADVRLSSGLRQKAASTPAGGSGRAH